MTGVKNVRVDPSPARHFFIGELIFWCGEGNACATWYELIREMQKEQALRSGSGLQRKGLPLGGVHRNNMCLSLIQLPAIRAGTVVHMLLVLVSAMCQEGRDE